MPCCSTLHITTNQALSPEQERVFNEFLRRWEDVTEPLADEIRDAVAGGLIDLSSLQAIRTEIEPRVGVYTADFEAVFREVSEEAAMAGRAVAGRRHQLDIVFDLVPERTITELEDWSVTASQSVSETMGEEITRWLRGAHEEGLGIDEIAEQFDSEYVTERMHDTHSQQLARDVTIGPSEAGSHSAHEDAPGVIAEEWVATLDGRERDAHAVADGQIVPVDGTFLVGGEELRNPHDPQGSVENTTQCRCSAVPVFADDLGPAQLEAIEAGQRIAPNGTIGVA